MPAPSLQPTPLDHCALVEKIRTILAQSPAFHGAQISLPLTIPEGEVTANVGFGPGPAQFRIVAPSVEKAYTILYELARVLVGGDERPPGRDCI